MQLLTDTKKGETYKCKTLKCLNNINYIHSQMSEFIKGKKVVHCASCKEFFSSKCRDLQRIQKDLKKKSQF